MSSVVHKKVGCFPLFIILKTKFNNKQSRKRGEKMAEDYSVIEMKAEEIIAPVVEGKGFELADLEFLQEGGFYYLRVYIDKESGISIDDCEDISRQIEEDVDRIIDKKFFLEVSSPGLERRLKKEKDFLKFVGKKIEVRLKNKVNDSKNFEGVIKKYESDTLFLDIKTEILEIPFKKIERAKLVFDFAELAGRDDYEE